MKSFSHERTPAPMTVDIEKSQEHVYNIKLRLSDREGATWETPRQISHIEMCRFNGVRLFDDGTLKGGFGCRCDGETDHCMNDGMIFFEIEEGHNGQLVSVRRHDALLICHGDRISGSRTVVEERHAFDSVSEHQVTNNGYQGQSFVFHKNEYFLNQSNKATRKSSKESGWGAKSGTEDDKEALRDIITSELKKPENLSMSNLCRITCLLTSSFES